MFETTTSISQIKKQTVINQNNEFITIHGNNSISYRYPPTSSIFESNAYSVELMRLNIRQKLHTHFYIQNDIIEIDYLLRNPDVLNVIFEVKNLVVEQFNLVSDITLDLHHESNDWETLFIKAVASDAEWEKTNTFINTFFKNLFKRGSEVAKKINIIISADAV